MASTSQSEPGSVSAAKRRKIEMPEGKKVQRANALNCICHFYIRIREALGLPDIAGEEVNLWTECNVVSFLASVQRLDKRVRVTDLDPAVATQEYAKMKIEVGEKSMTGKDAQVILEELYVAYGIKDTFTKVYNPIITPICAQLCLFKMRMGTGVIPTGKNTTEPLDAWGLFPAHVPLLEGIRFSPHYKSSLSTTVGPLTQAIALNKKTRSQDKKYGDKWRSALDDSISHLRFHKDIINQIATSSQEQIAPLLGALGDVLLFTGSRIQRRVALPLFAIMRKYEADTITTMKTGTAVKVGYFGITGKAAITIANAMPKFKFPKIGTTDMTRQVIFHCIYGTVYENLELLKLITTFNTEWARRHQMSAGLKKVAANAPEAITPIKLKFRAKPTSTNQSEFCRSQSQQVSSIPCMSGKYTVEAKSLLTYLTDTQDIQMTGGKSVHQLTGFLKGMSKSFAEHCKKNDGKLVWGNTSWEFCGDIQNPEELENPVLNERFFYSTDQVV